MTATTDRSAGAPAPDSLPRHPLAPLTVEEAATAARLAMAATGEGARLVYVALDEPDKAAVLGWDGAPLPRTALVVTYAKPSHLTWMITVSLDEPAVIRQVPVPGAQPPIMIDEWMSDSEGIRADPAFQAAVARRGITDMSRIQIDPWPASYFGLDIDSSGRRLARGVAYVLDGPGCNPYARPIENLVAIWDRDAREMVELQDGEVVPVPQAPGRYDAASFPEPRALAPLDIVQPSGAGFTVEDGRLRWGPWQLRLSLHPIEGLVLHEVYYVDGERARPVLYRASLAEMVVPYGSTSLNHWWKNAFDAGDVGLGKMANSLELGATASARSSTSTRSACPRMARQRRCRMRSACTRRTTASSGSTPTC